MIPAEGLAFLISAIIEILLSAILNPANPNNPGYQSPFHPIPNHPNPQGGWGWVDLEEGHPCYCPNPYDPISNPNGDILVNCDNNQPVNPDHPCPIPPPAGLITEDPIEAVTVGLK